MARDISYVEMLLTERWKHKREQILERDQCKCRNCGCNKNLQVHHRQYHRDPKTGLKREPWDYDNQYLVTLCEKCHDNGHQQYQIPFFNH